ncbi:hypothetical protein ASG67_16360 [Sphingomonas sp. Leaf339]|uniref:DUF4174 domain-containing protein n=1 Tax=Sphingomonas sp. Leaf339 TaxID=1736343 RepID=UPI0006FED340|nr:hypothetical protein ASG67_16360 [Sphingomonas sp. Leaf339]
MLPVAGLVALAIAAQSAGMGVGDMRGQRRVLIMNAATATDPLLIAQRRALAGWRKGAEDRDVTVVEAIGDRVTGTRDAATALRRTYRLPADRFAVVLIGKDGTVAFRATDPVLPEQLQGTIDAMPMRRAGGR